MFPVIFLIAYVVFGVMFTAIEFDWMDARANLPNTELRKAVLAIATFIFWPIVLIAMGVAILSDDL